MAHFRAQIRADLEAIATALPGVGSAGLRDSRDIAAQDSELPVAVVAFDDETIGDHRPSTEDVEITTRTLSASVGVCCTTPAQVDELAEALERALASDVLPCGARARLAAMRFEDPRRGERDFFSVSASLEIVYDLASGSPDRLFGG